MLLCCVILLVCIRCLFEAVLNPVVVVLSRLVDVLSPLVPGLRSLLVVQLLYGGVVMD